MEKFTIICKGCGSENVTVMGGWNGAVVFICKDCDETEEE